MKSELIIRKLSLSLVLFSMLWLILPATQEAGAQTGTSFNIVPPKEIQEGDVFNVELTVTGANNLYGLEVTCQVDPTILSWQKAQFGDFFTESLMGANSVDAESGTWTGAISQRNPAPALFGDGLYATLTFEAAAPGISKIACKPLAVDRDGRELPMIVNNASVTVLETTGGIGGYVTYQGRTEHTGISIEVAGPVNKTIQTTVKGQFSLGQLDQGHYHVKADSPLYLPRCAEATIAGSEAITLMSQALVGGDTDDSDSIKINDATLLGGNFGLTAASSPAMDARADINNDGQVNIQDLSILGGNFGKEGCQEWPVSSASPA